MTIQIRFKWLKAHQYSHCSCTVETLSFYDRTRVSTISDIICEIKGIEFSVLHIIPFLLQRRGAAVVED